jgi:taurine dioxygenase
MTIELKPLSPYIGLEVIGVDLTRPLDEAVQDQIREAWIRAGVLLFRGAGSRRSTCG